MTSRESGRKGGMVSIFHNLLQLLVVEMYALLVLIIAIIALNLDEVISFLEYMLINKTLVNLV
jgi:hypothetical protein